MSYTSRSDIYSLYDLFEWPQVNGSIMIDDDEVSDFISALHCVLLIDRYELFLRYICT